MNARDSDDIVNRLQDAAGSLLVRRAIDRNDWIADALLDIAAGDQLEWTLAEWEALLTGLRQTPGRVRDWLDLNVI